MEIQSLDFQFETDERDLSNISAQDNNCGVNVSERVGDVLVPWYVPFTWRQVYSFRFLLSVACCLLQCIKETRAGIRSS